MHYNTMGCNGEKPSLLGFGCMRFPTVVQDGQERIDEAEAVRMMEKAIEGGVNYFDTAYPYHGGESELVVGRFMKDKKREDFYIATKLPMWEVKTREDVSRLFEEQLEKLQMDYVDYYMLHALDKGRWELAKKLDILGILEGYRAEGKIRNIGFSFHDAYETFDEIIRARQWDFCQIQFNYMDVEVQAGMKGCRLAEELGIPVIVMEPVKGGSLVNFADDVKAILAKRQPTWSLASWAIRWAASVSGVKLILSGMTTMEQVEDNLATMNGFTPMTDEDYQTLDEAVRVIRARTRNNCTACAYCMPCPFGIEIPRCFQAWNQYEMYQSENVIRWDYLAIEKDKRADKCTECGACEEQCPQHISIREDLKTISSEFKPYESRW